jgi:hypothetical protein
MEEGGSESIYHLCRSLLEERPPALAVVAIPQVNVRWYASRFLEGRKQGTFYSEDEVLSRTPCLQEYSHARLVYDMTRYGRMPEIERFLARELAPEIQAVQHFIDHVQQDIAPVVVSLDFHETFQLEGYLLEEDKVFEVRGKQFLYIEQVQEAMEAVGMHYPVCSKCAPEIPRFGSGSPAAWQRYLEGLPPKDLSDAADVQSYGFSGYLRLRGARSFVAETPSQLPLEERIGMNALGTDWILREILPSVLQ